MFMQHSANWLQEFLSELQWQIVSYLFVRKNSESTKVFMYTELIGLFALPVNTYFHFL